MKITHYFDYKSPYAYLAQAPTLALAQEFAAELDLVPYTLDIPSFLGSAEVDSHGNVLSSERNAHQWRRVRYAYMDCRREANARGLVIRGPRKIFDSSVAHIAFLFAQSQGNPRPFHERVFELFWRRELDIEDERAMRSELTQCGFETAEFPAFMRGQGARRLRELREQAEQQGVFGVPSYLVDGELFWGAERLERVRERLVAKRT